MKILITTDLFITDTNGVVTSVRNLRQGLEKKGHEVRILTLSGSRKSYCDGKVYYIKSVSMDAVYPNIRVAVSYRNSLIRELIDWKPDVIHSQCEFFTFQFAKYISKNSKAPIIHTYHTLYEQYVTYVIPFRRFGKYIVRVLSRKRLKCVDTVIVPTHKVAAILRDYCIQKPICVIPSGISLEQHAFRMTERERSQKRQELGIRSDARVLLNLGRIGTEKNLEELLALFAEAVSNNDRLTFLIVGDGPDKARLERLAETLGIAGQVVFTGMVASSEVQKYYQLGDIFVSASTSETQGLTYIEAAANGLPLLCRRDSCLRDVIEKGLNGYEYETSEEFHCYLNAMLEDANWRKTAGKHSEEKAVYFDKNRFADNIEEIYNSVLLKRSSMKG